MSGYRQLKIRHPYINGRKITNSGPKIGKHYTFDDKAKGTKGQIISNLVQGTMRVKLEQINMGTFQEVEVK